MKWMFKHNDMQMFDIIFKTNWITLVLLIVSIHLKLAIMSAMPADNEREMSQGNMPLHIFVAALHELKISLCNIFICYGQ